METNPFDFLTRGLIAPLEDMEARYRSAASVALDVAGGLNRLATAARGPASPPSAPLVAEESDVELQARLDVNFQDDATLLDFQDAVRRVPGVVHVTSLGGGPRHVTLLVDLEPPATGEATETRDLGDSPRPTLICTVCNKVLDEGGSQVSHGLCDDCAAQFVDLRRQHAVSGEYEEPSEDARLRRSQ